MKRVELPIPEKCKHRRFDGGVFIYEAVVTDDGDVANIETIKAPKFTPPCPELEMAARQAISEWKYEPGRLKGRPVATHLTITVLIEVR